MKKFWEKEELVKNKIYITVSIMLLIQLTVLIYCFQFKKEGCHSDEIWSYGYANSYYQKDIYIDAEGKLINTNKWVDGQVLRDYIVVNKGEEFAYDSIYQNQMYDLSPPFHSMLLHTICSFFPEKYSRWFSFSINIVSYILCFIFLFKTAKILKDDYFALCCCFIYGFSVGARDTFIYLRMYGLCTALTMMMIYYTVSILKKVKKQEKMSKGNIIGLCIVSYIAFLTHYYMIAFAGIMTVFVCILLLFQRKWKAMFIYGFSMLGILVLSIMTFPSLITSSQYQGEKIASDAEQLMNYNFDMRIRIIFNFLMMKLFNIHVSIYHSGFFPIMMAYLFVFILFIIPIGFLFRNTRVVKWILQRIRFLIIHFKSVVKYLWRRINWVYIIFIITILCQIIVVGETSNVFGMGSYEDRYIMNLYPVAMLTALAFVYQIGIILLRKKKYSNYLLFGIVIMLFGFNIRNRINFNDYYFPQLREGALIEDSVKDKPCIYVMDKAWMLTTLAPELMHAKEFFQVGYLNYVQFEKDYREKIENEQVVLLIDTTFSYAFVTEIDGNDNIKINENNIAETKSDRYKEIIDYFEDLEPTTKMKKLTTQGVFGRKMEAYLINP